MATLIQEASSALQRKQYDRAISSCSAALEASPDRNIAFFIYYLRALAYADIGEFGKAIADHSKAIQFDPRSASTFYARGLNYERLEQFEKAIADYDRVIRIAPKNSDDYAARGAAYFTKGNYKDAVSNYEKPSSFPQITITH